MIVFVCLQEVIKPNFEKYSYICRQIEKEMKRSLHILLFVLLATLQAQAATKSYKELSRWDNERLLTEASLYMDRLCQPDSALLCLSIIVSRNEIGKDKANSHLTAYSLMQMGYIYMSFLVDYGRAYTYLRRAQDISLREGYPDVLSCVYGNLGILSYMESNIFAGADYDAKAIDYYRKALRISLTHRFSDNSAICFLNMALVAVLSGNASSILADARLVESTYSKVHFANPAYLLYVARGIEHQAAKRYLQAKKNFVAALHHVKACNAVDSLRYVTTGLELVSMSCQKAGRYADAISYLKQALLLATTHHLPDEVMGIYKQMAQNYSLAGQHDLAREFRYRHLEAKNNFIRSSHLHHVAQEKFECEMNTNNALLKASLLRQRHMETAFGAALAVALVISTLLCIMFRLYRKQKSYAETLYRKNIELMKLQTEKYASSGLDESGKQSLRQRIGNVMDDVEVIASPDFSLQQLAEKVGSNSRYVSQVINECYGCNFRALLNDRRVKEACCRLSDKENFGHFTIDAIASSVGFRSRSNFLNVFKKITGLSPSEFQLYAKEKPVSDSDAS